VPSAVKIAAEELGLTLEQPASLRDESVVSTIAAYKPDVICVAAFGMLLPPDILAIPPHGCLNVHASLLPAYRGAAPVHRAILNGDEQTGVVIMRMAEGLDTGPFANPVTVDVDDHTVESLTALLAEQGAQALLRTLDELESGGVAWVDQDEELATFAPKVTSADLELDPGLSVETLLRRVRSSTPSARARACIDGRSITVVKARRSDMSVPPGRVLVGKNELVLGCLDGAILAEEVRPEGKASMDGACFARGARLAEDCLWVSEQ
jgi:methionyl-tRNA formyltransferase